MSHPTRIQRKRSKGWRMPEGAVYIGRGSQWGNPYVIGRDGTAKECIEKYARDWLPYTHQPPHNSTTDFLISQCNLEGIIHSLRGKTLACWCKETEPCHGDWLLKIANEVL
jgi:hypothetical protein